MSQDLGLDRSAAEAFERDASDHGTGAAASKNRETQSRQQIVKALQSLGGEFSTKWPDFVREFCCDPREQSVFKDYAIPPPFQPPDFDRLNQSPEAWVRAATAKWQQYCANFLRSCRNSVVDGVDDEIPSAKQVRGPGIKSGGKRGKNTILERRYVWAAKYLLGVPLKEIAWQDSADAATVGRVARATLRHADWLELTKVRKRASRA